MSNGGPTSNKIVSDLGKRLLEAARLGNTDEVSSLMSNGAPLTTDWLGTTPLHLASIYGHTSTAEILIKSGISKDGRTKVDKAPLHFACQHGNLEIVKLLVNGGAHINAADMLKMTPLHWAVEANSFDICLFLLKAGVKTDMKNKFDKTALKIADDKGYDPIVQILSDEKFQMLQEIDVLHHNVLRDRHVSSVKICRNDNFNNTFNMMKKPKTRRFPMVAGTWTGGEAQTQERLEINERKKLGVYKRRQHQRDSLANSLLKNLQTSSITSSTTEFTSRGSNLHSLVSAASIINATNGSPLQKLEQTVRLSTSDLEMNTSSNSSEVTNPMTSTPNTSLVMSLPHTSLQIPVQIPSKRDDASSDEFSLKNKIPVISSLTLNSLPPNVQAIPLNMTADDLAKEHLQNNSSFNTSTFPISDFWTTSSSTLTLSNLTQVASIDSSSVSSSVSVANNIESMSISSPSMLSPPQSIVPPVFNTPALHQDAAFQQPTVPVNIPVELLNQILGGEVTLHTLAASKLKDGQSPDVLPGITTEMGTIPLIPVSGEGGLKLIPLENAPDAEAKSSRANGNTAAQIIPSQQMLLQPPHMMPHGLGSANLSMLAAHHGGFDVASAILASRHTTPGLVNVPISTQIQPPVIMPAGIYLQPGHPALLHGQPNLFQPQHSYIHPSMLPSVVHSGGQPYVHPALHQPLFHPGLVQPAGHHPGLVHPGVPQYFYFGQGNAAFAPHLPAPLPNIVTSTHDSPQKPDSST